MKKIYFTLILFSFSLLAMAQEYKRMMSEGSYAVEAIIAEAEAFFEEKGKGKGTGYKQFRRWKYQALRNVGEDGKLKSPEFYYQELQNYNNYLNQNFGTARTTVGTWEQLGPTSWNQTGGWNPGVGRITSLAIDNGNSDHILAGAESGGVWKTTNAGSTWAVLTDNMSNLFVYALAIDPNNQQTYYWGTSSGTIFKSTDGGSTWNFLSDIGIGRVNKIIVDPSDSNKLFCSSDFGGIFKSLDAGATWTKIHPTANIGYDVEFKPGNSQIVYAAGNNFYVSIDGGNSFSSVSGFSGGVKMIGVSNDDDNVVYVLEAENNYFGGLYKSTDSGATFSQMDHTGKNYFGYSSDPQDISDENRGQAPRDMDISINPNDVNDVHIAGINTWRSTDGGITFNITSQWIPQNAASQNIGYCHADIDIMEFVDGKLFLGTDGGIYVANTPTTVNSSYYSDLTTGMGIRQFYKIGVSQTDPAVVSGGAQDNGTSVYGAATWSDWLGADGMETFVDKNNSSILYGTSQYGSLYRSLNGGLSSTALTQPDGKGGQNNWNWVVPFEQDPIASNTIYVAFDEVYKSTDSGASWTSISQNFGANVDHLKIAKTSSNFMYLAVNGTLYKNTFAGIIDNWTSLTGYSGSINDIAIHPSDPNRVAIATTSAQKVYVSTDGGSNWTSYNFNLPNFSAQDLVWDDNGNNGLYLGMNYGVYYIDDTTGNTWQPFSNNLPNVIVSELEINDPENKIYAGTYGRGLWRSDLYNTLSVKDYELEEFSIYPNPATNKINLKWDKSESVNIRVFNALGKMMFYSSGQVIEEPFSIDASNYASGLYFVRINTNKGTMTKKVIIE